MSGYRTWRGVAWSATVGVVALALGCGGEDEPSEGTDGASTGGVGIGGASTGGVVTGGSATGGSVTGGSSTGGVGTGGASTGGASTGGVGTGGSATGGSATGGAPAGGAATGGLGTGGTSTGGSSTGGFATGGTVIGGTGTGGTASGGVATGGVATGGAATGGTQTGGAETGGAEAGGAETGGADTGGTTTGGAASGGAPTGGAATGGSGTGGGGDDWFPCDGSTDGYDATAIQSGGTWTVTAGGTSRYTGADMAAAMAAAYGALSSGRTTKQSVLIQGSGDVSADAQIRIPGYTIVNLCGTLNVTGTASQSDRSPFYARGATDIDIPHATITGNPQYGMFFRQVSRIHLGQLELRFGGTSSGIGVRIDNNPSAGGAFVTDVAIDTVYAETTGSHGVETYGVDGFTLGRLDGVDTGECGVLLNMSVNAEIGSVHCDNCGAGTGYAAFRMANRNGRVGDGYPVNVHVGEVYARGGGRGVFCVSESGGAVIDRVDLADTGSNAILLENCYNVTIAAESGRVEGPGDVRIAARDEFANSADITLSNLTLIDTVLNESPCGDNTTLLNNVFQSSTDNSCD